MSSIDPSIIEALLNMSEGDTLDFKEEQYRIDTDDSKSELVKDILAFANAWKTSDAYILRGVKDNPGGRATITGVASHIDDATVQQIVNGKTNTPVAFEYHAVTIDGLPVGIIRVRANQQRPIYSQNDYGKLKAKAVYLRRGSSTAIARPEEIARMGAESARAAHEPVLEVSLADPEKRIDHGDTVELVSQVLRERPPLSKEEKERLHEMTKMYTDLLGPMHKMEALIPRAISMAPRVDLKDLIEYRKQIGLLNRIGFKVHNAGRTVVEDLRIVFEIPKTEGLVILDEMPEKPSVYPMLRPFHRTAIDTVVRDFDGFVEITARLGKVQPNATVWSSPCYVGSLTPMELAIDAQVFGDNISTPDIHFTIKITTKRGWVNESREDDDADDSG